MKRKRIAIVATGGTIAGSGKVGEASHYEAGTLPVDDILASIPQIQELADLELINFCAKDSNDVSADDLYGIKKIVEQLDGNPEIDGVVITHGTDTLEETAFFLNLILHVHKPVVMTGAMRPATATSADGPMNLYQAIALACDLRVAKMGVLCVFSDTIYSGRDLTKTNSIKTDAFKTAEIGPLGYMRDDQAYLIQAPYRRHTIHSRFSRTACPPQKRVEIFYVHQDSDPVLLEWMLEHYDGVILAGTGAGNYSDSIRQVIESYEGSCVLVRTSRLLEGGAFESPVFDPTHRCIPAFKLSAHKARILLMLGLNEGLNRHELERLFLEY